MESDKICQNCSSFVQDDEDLATYFGVCVMNEEFEPFLDEILDRADFSNCYELYKKQRYDGEREACVHYEEPEDAEMLEEEYMNAYTEQIKHHNVDEIIKYFYDSNIEIASKAVSAISMYVYVGNESAYKGLVKFFMEMGPAASLEDVHFRIKIIEILSAKKTDKNTIDAYINELARTPSNNTTRQLYTEILKRLSSCPKEMVQEPLLELIDKKQYSYKIKNRIMEVATARDKDEYWYR